MDLLQHENRTKTLLSRDKYRYRVVFSAIFLGLVMFFGSVFSFGDTSAKAQNLGTQKIQSMQKIAHTSSGVNSDVNTGFTNLQKSLNGKANSSLQHKVKSGEVRVEIANFTKPWLAPDDDLIFQIDIFNGSEKDLPLKSISVGMQNTVANSQYLLYYWLQGMIASRPLFSFTTSQNVPAGEVKRVEVKVPREKISWSTEKFGWGPQGVEACVISTDNSNTAKLNKRNLCDRSVTVVAPSEEINPMPMAISYPLTLNSTQLLKTPDFHTLLRKKKSNPSLLKDATTLPKDTLQQLSRTVTNFDYPGVTYFIDPAFLEDSQFQQKLTEITQANKLLLPFRDTDIQALFSAKHSDLVQKAFRFSDEIRTKNNLENLISADKIAVLSGVPTHSELAELAQIGLHTAIVPGAQRAITHEYFYTQEATRKVALKNKKATKDKDLQSKKLENGEKTEKSANEKDFTLLINNDQISRALQGVLTTYQDQKGINLSPVNRAQVALALSAIYFNEAPNLSRPLLIQVPRNIANIPHNQQLQLTLQNSLKALSQAPWLKPSSIPNLINPKAQIRTLPSTTPIKTLNSESGLTRNPNSTADTSVDTPISDTEISQLLTNEKSFLAKANIFRENSDFTQVAERKLLSALATSWRSDPVARKKYLTQIFDSQLFATGLKFEPSSPVNMISESSSLPVRVMNDFNMDVQVRVVLVSPDQRLKNSRSEVTTIPAKQIASVSVPMQARGSGNIRVLLQLFSADGKQLDPQTHLPMRIRADWENTGTAILASFFAIVLVYGIYRSVKTGRRAKTMTQAEIDAFTA